MSTTPGDFLTRLAGEDLRNKNRYIVKLDSNNKAVVATAATDDILGVLDEVSQGATGPCAIRNINASGTGKVRAGATFAKGAYLTVDSTGRAVAAAQTTAGQQPTKRVFGRALAAASAIGDIVEYESMNLLY